ncbi:histone acetyltransferase type B catalytic subunit-like isoform X2 [Corylus avellana]|uniref:histone acetyltransferase type B catalytic subunit-like isoform X2 n=1 Tax=Corylus avellana TaxID=13451 RepID=UPI00286D2FE9|nr:histone acetyltransferase type B catalytic subunit-like isoform X2 [Corylus avellana]
MYLIVCVLVSSKEEVGYADSLRVNPVDLYSFFDGDGKIYGYQGLQITIWVSSISFHAYADITFESKSDRGKGITDLKAALQRIFAETLVENKHEFLQTFSTESNLIRSIISSGEILNYKTSNGNIADSNSHLKAANSDVEVVRMVVGTTAAGHLYSRLIPLVLLLVDGRIPIDVIDPRWELYVLIQKKTDRQDDIQCRLLGFTAIYRFYHYPDSSRLQLSQMLVLPPYQHQGYGGYLLEVINDVAVAEDVYDLTVERPLDYFQHVRSCVDVSRLFDFDPIEGAFIQAVSRLKRDILSKKIHIPRLMPPSSLIDDVRRSLKITKKQFIKCWEVLIYLGLDPIDEYMEDFVSVISNRVENHHILKRVIEVPSDYDQEMSFVTHRSPAGEGGIVQMGLNQTNLEEQLRQRQLVDKRVEGIKLIELAVFG